MVSPEPIRTSDGSLSRIRGNVAESAEVGPFVVLEEGASVGDGCVIHAHAFVGRGVDLGAGVVVHAGAVIGREPGGAGATAREVDFARRVRIGSGCAIGCNAVIYYDVEIGSETLIGDGASIREGGRIGSRCIVSRCVTLNYNVSIGDRVKVMDNTHLTGNCRLDDGAFVSTCVATTNDNSPLEDLDRELTGPWIRESATVGAGATLLPGVVVGRSSTVAAGAVVTHDVADGTVVFGVPARPRA